MPQGEGRWPPTAEKPHQGISAWYAGEGDRLDTVACEGGTEVQG